MFAFKGKAVSFELRHNFYFEGQHCTSLSFTNTCRAVCDCLHISQNLLQNYGSLWEYAGNQSNHKHILDAARYISLYRNFILVTASNKQYSSHLPTVRGISTFSL